MIAARAHRAPVVIVGAGSTGCTLALLLASYGIQSILLERRTAPMQHPAAHVINGRTLEIWSGYSHELAGEIAALGPTMDEIGDIRWGTRLTDPPLGALDLMADRRRVDLVLSFCQYHISHVGQHQLMPVLWRWVESEPLISFMKGVSVGRLTRDARSVELEASRHDGGTVVCQADWLAGCDGANSWVREDLGIVMQGPVLAHMASVFFSAKLDTVLSKPHPLLTWIYNPNFCGVLIKHAHDHYILMGPFVSRSQQIVKNGEAYWSRIIPDVIGADIPFEIKTQGNWSMTAQLAERFQLGRVLLVGDAAHRFPHTGGFGLNSGVQDAQNIAWKLAAVLERRASDALLDSYEHERKPVIKRFAEQSVGNHFKLDEVTKYLNLGNRSLISMTKAFERAPIKWLGEPVKGRLADALMKLALSKTLLLEKTGAKSQKLREQIQRAIPDQFEHFVSTGLEFGYAYESGLVIPEGTTQPKIGAGVIDYQPTTWPGSRLPHAMVEHQGNKRPLIDRIDKRKFTLLVHDGASWINALQTLPWSWSPFLSLTTVQQAEEKTDPDDALVSLLQVGRQGAVLVRPDGHVAWRTGRAAMESVKALHEAMHCLTSTYAKDHMAA